VKAFVIAGGMLVVVALAFVFSRSAGAECDFKSGGRLVLLRNDVRTVRARFCYAQDCELIATQMNKVEKARWHCE
jgi:hypothetical protein